MLVTQVVFVLLNIHREAPRAVFPGLMLLPGSWYTSFRELKDAKFFHSTVFCTFLEQSREKMLQNKFLVPF